MQDSRFNHYYLESIKYQSLGSTKYLFHKSFADAGEMVLLSYYNLNFPMKFKNTFLN